MIAGIGIDSVDVTRIAEKIRKEDFKQKVFSAKEIEYCEKNAHPEQHFAARFAGKEAFLKAAGTGLGVSYELSQIEILHNEKGVPAISFHGEFEKFTAGIKNIHISISHTSSLAMAIVILEK
jgi:holo-[acyl-carrier protein] synthase